MRLQNPFAALSPTGLDSQVLTVLARADAELTPGQIHALLPEGGSLEGVRQSVRRLASHGTVIERRVGRSMAYELNARHLLAGPIREIARAKQHLIDLLSSHVREWRLQPLTVKLFGSAARSEMTDGSDIDVLVVMPDSADRDEAEARVGNLASVTRDLTGNDVRPLLYFESEVEQAGIFDSILADGIDIAGDPSWLRRNLRARG